MKVRTLSELRLLLHRGRVFDRFGLERIGVFGSFARGESFRDIDMLVSHTEQPSLTRLLRFREWLEQQLACPIDVVIEELANPIVLHRAQKDLKMIKRSENDLLHLLDMLQAIAKVSYYARNFHTEWHFYEAEMQLYFNACLNLLARLGEKTNKLSDSLKTSYADIPWEQIRGYRNRLVHDYEGVNIAQTFEIIKVHLPDLQASLEKMVKQELQKGTFEREEFEVAKQSEFYALIDFTRLE